MKSWKFALTALVVLLMIFSTLTYATAQDDGAGIVCAFGMCEKGGDGTGGEPIEVGGLAVPEESAGVEVEGLGRSVVYTVNGGYTAAGVGLRNNGSGTITVSGIPKKAKVYKAFLYWNIVDYDRAARHKLLLFNGVSVTGTYIGATNQTCWITDYGSSFSYRADVTSLVKGNGSYAIAKVASGLKTGVDPWSSAPVTPLAQGASLVVIYQKSSYPTTQVFIWDGAANTNSNPYITMGPYTALTNPVGPVKTTAIVADGQSSSSGPTLSVNYQVVAGSDFDGKDPKKGGGSYLYGNLWDTSTFNVGSLLSPGGTQVRIEMKGSADCAAWVAQVLSVSSGNVDTDGDALLDGWEANGWMGVDLPAMGADPFHKDIFVENDWMTGLKPQDAVLETIRQSFLAAPVSNPDGIKGINLHSDIGQSRVFSGGNEVPFLENWDPSGCQAEDIWAAFDSYKEKNFNPARLDTFHYMIWSNNQCPTTSSSGRAKDIPSSDFIVTLGWWPGDGTQEERQGTYMHELGHNLGLTHGGFTDDHVNYKPNHLSIMSYSFQTVGVWRDSARRWDYQRTNVDALNETALNETIGLTNGGTSLSTYGVRYYCPNGTFTEDFTAATIDWNCNGSANNLSVSVDTNKDTYKNTLHSTHNQWTHIIYNGGSIGAGEPLTALGADFFDDAPCLSYDDVH